MFNDKLVKRGFYLFISGFVLLLLLQLIRFFIIRNVIKVNVNEINATTIFVFLVVLSGIAWTLIIIGIILLIVGIIKFKIIKYKEGYKQCQFCAKTIKKEAIVCPFCSRDLPKV
jgi:nitric oxide reductase large subunit